MKAVAVGRAAAHAAVATALLIGMGTSGCASPGTGSAPAPNGTIVPADTAASFGSPTVAPRPRSTTVDLADPLVSTLVESDWVLTEVDGRAPGNGSDTFPLPFRFFADGTYSYSDGCNQNSGSYVVTGSRVDLTRGSSTTAACLTVDQALLDNLMRMENQGLEFAPPAAGKLTARTGDDRSITFTFQPSTAVTTAATT